MEDRVFYHVGLASAPHVDVVVSEAAIAYSETLLNNVSDANDLQGLNTRVVLRPLSDPELDLDEPTLRFVLGWCERQVSLKSALAVETDAMKRAILKHEETSRTQTSIRALARIGAFKLICATNFLEIPALKAAVCTDVADRIKDMSVEQLREFLGVVNDMTEEEMDQAKRENAWCEERA